MHCPQKIEAFFGRSFFDESDKDTVCRDYGVKREYLRVLLHRARCRFRELLADPAATSSLAARTSGGAPQMTGRVVVTHQECDQSMTAEKYILVSLAD